MDFSREIAIQLGGTLNCTVSGTANDDAINYYYYILLYINSRES